MRKPIIISVVIHGLIIAGFYAAFLFATKPQLPSDTSISVDLSSAPQEHPMTVPPVIKHELAEKVVKKIEETPAPVQTNTEAKLSGGYQVIPKYPEGLRRRSIEGEVVLKAQILPDGTVGTIEIVKSAGYASFDNSAMEAVKQWHFNPAVQNGVPVSSYIKIPVKFTLN